MPSAAAKTAAAPGGSPAADAYRLEAHVGHLLRRASQRHLALFSERIAEVTPRQFAALAKLHENGPVSQNQLGRDTAMDAATIKGVIDRLGARGLVEVAPSARDRRRVIVSLTGAGAALFAELAEAAFEVTEATLAPLDAEERARLLALLARIA